jgi:transcriptional regulator with XRE-family HTH domain
MRKINFANWIRWVRSGKQLSYKDVERNSGSRISSGYLHQIENEQVDPNAISVEKLKAIAKGLGESEDLIFRVARGLDPNDQSPFEVYAERFDAHDLSENEWRFLERYFKEHIERWRTEKEERLQEIENLIRETDLLRPKIDDIEKMLESDELDPDTRDIAEQVIKKHRKRQQDVSKIREDRDRLLNLIDQKRKKE